MRFAVFSHHLELHSTVRLTGLSTLVLALAHAINRVQQRTVVAVQIGGKAEFKSHQHHTPKTAKTPTLFGKAMSNPLYSG
jgi:hypothetical protein